MRTQGVTMSLFGAACGAGLLMAWGPLDPPPGPPQPTMHTLDDIYEQVAQDNPPQVWKLLRVILPKDLNVYKEVISGSGVLHAVISNHADNSTIRNGDGSVILRTVDTFTYSLDIRYENGLEIARTYDYCQQCGEVLFLYLPDP